MELSSGQATLAAWLPDSPDKSHDTTAANFRLSLSLESDKIREADRLLCLALESDKKSTQAFGAELEVFQIARDQGFLNCRNSLYNWPDPEPEYIIPSTTPMPVPCANLLLASV